MLSYIIIGIVVVIVGFILLALVGFVLMLKGRQPNTPDTSVNQLKQFLGYSFQDKYILLEHSSNNLHPDSPLKISINFHSVEFVKVKDYLEKIELNNIVSYSNEKKVKYEVEWRKMDNFFYKTHSAQHTDREFPFFVATLTADCDKKTLSYKESGF
jgi:hypothetical protein